VKKIYTSLMFLFLSVVLFAQSINTELVYLRLVNGQKDKMLIKDNLRNAELTADSLFFVHKAKVNDSVGGLAAKAVVQQKDDLLASYFFKELGMSYFYTKNYPMAMFTFLRQRYFYPNDTLNEIVSAYFVDAAAFSGIKKNIAEFLLRKSDPATLNKIPFEERKVMFLDKVIFLNLEPLNGELSKYVDFTRESNVKIPEFVSKWAFLTKINVPHSLMEGYMNYYKGALDSLNFKQKKIMYRKAARYYLKHNAWVESDKYIGRYCGLPLKINNRITCCWLKLRRGLHL